MRSFGELLRSLRESSFSAPRIDVFLPADSCFPECGIINYINLKSSYISAIQAGLMLKADYEEAKRGNEILHSFCEICIDNSNYSEQDKQSMKHELKLVKEALSQEIEHYFNSIK